MITLLNRDERERGAAVDAVLRRCNAARARLLVITGEAALADFRRSLRWTIRAPEQVQLVPLDPRLVRVDGRDELCRTLRALRALVLPHTGESTPLVVWIECPLSPRAFAVQGDLVAYERGLAQHVAPLVATLISAYFEPEAGQLALGRCFGRGKVVMTGTSLSDRGVELEIAGDHGDRAGAPTARSWLSLAELLRAENLGDSGLLITRFLYELSDPLAVVSSALQHLHERLPVDDATLELLTMALLGAERMQALLQCMRCLAPAVPLERREADLNDLVLAALRSATEDCHRRGLVPEASLADEPLRGRFDPARLMQVLLNLLMNAIAASPAPGGVLCVRTRVGEDGLRAIVAVENGGVQRTGAAVGRLFRPFFMTTADDTGLGLGISSQIVMAHGGAIHVDDVEGGVRFIVVLPLGG